MPDARYFLPEHKSLQDTYSKDDLRRLVHAGRLSRSEMVLDDVTGQAHLLGDLLAAPFHGTAPPGRSHAAGGDVEIFRASTPLPRPESRDTPDYDDDDAHPADDGDDEAWEDSTDEESVMEAAPVVPAVLRRVPRTEDLHDMSPGIESSPEEKVEEELFYHGRPSWFSYPKSVVATATFGTAAWLCYKYNAGIIWAGTLGALSGLIMVFIMLDRTTTEYFVTSRRVEMERGIIGRNTKEIRIADIRAIDVTQKGWNAILGVGTVEFFSAAGDEADVVFANIWRPHRVKERVRELQG